MTKKTRRAKARRALLSISLVLVMMMVAVGGTIAWLTDSTDEIKNTFTVGEIDIDLTEKPKAIPHKKDRQRTTKPVLL